MSNWILRFCCTLLTIFWLAGGLSQAQERDTIPELAPTDLSQDTLHLELPDSLRTRPAEIKQLAWRPNPKKALWMALVIPGGGQIYNRKYWKLPIVYGGFVGCAYALNWNNMMYRDYSQAYLDIMDSDEKTDSWKNFLPYGVQVNESNKGRYQQMLKNKKDYYRKYRDLSVFCFIGVYLLSVIDAYVDAELSSFDINDDLSLRIEPVVIHNSPVASSPLNRGGTYGVQCSLRF